MAIATGEQATAADVNAAIAGRFASGVYTGNSAVNRTIPHGMVVTPKIVLIYSVTQPSWYRIMQGYANILFQGEDGATNWQIGVIAVTAPDATNFHVGNAGNYPDSANLNTRVYHWVAIG